MRLKSGRIILIVDAQSFYASVEKAARPELRNKPVAVGDPERRSGIILAACPIAKSQGVTTASRVGEALAKCLALQVIKPRMSHYIRVSLLITRIFEMVSPLVEPYSIDEWFVDVTAAIKMFGSLKALIDWIRTQIMLSTGVNVRIGVGPNKVLAKMALDNFAKQSPDGVYELNEDNIERDLWPLPISQMFMVASKMTYHFFRMGIHSIGDLARLELPEFAHMMKLRMGKQSDIQAEYYWQTARGIDPSPVEPSIRGALKSVSHGKALRANLYTRLADIKVVLLELVGEVCRRARRLGYQGRVVAVGAMEVDEDGRASGFSRQTTLPQPTALTDEVSAVAVKLLRDHWGGNPVGRLYVALNNLTDDIADQLTLFDDRPKKYALERTSDDIKDRYGDAAIMRASSLLAAGVARERAGQIGGHYR